MGQDAMGNEERLMSARHGPVKPVDWAENQKTVPIIKLEVNRPRPRKPNPASSGAVGDVLSNFRFQIQSP
jgi:hypothetical protein